MFCKEWVWERRWRVGGWRESVRRVVREGRGRKGGRIVAEDALEMVMVVEGEDVEVAGLDVVAVVDAGGGGRLGLNIVGQESNIEQLR